MPWPREHEGKVQCINFPDRYLPAIKNAVDNRMVKWAQIRMFMYGGSAEFEWAGCTWEIEEIREIQEYVTYIKLLTGTLTEEDLTAAALKGKIEVS